MCKNLSTSAAKPITIMRRSKYYSRILILREMDESIEEQLKNFKRLKYRTETLEYPEEIMKLIAMNPRTENILRNLLVYEFDFESEDLKQEILKKWEESINTKYFKHIFFASTKKFKKFIKYLVNRSIPIESLYFLIHEFITLSPHLITLVAYDNYNYLLKNGMKANPEDVFEFLLHANEYMLDFEEIDTKILDYISLNELFSVRKSDDDKYYVLSVITPSVSQTNLRRRAKFIRFLLPDSAFKVNALKYLISEFSILSLIALSIKDVSEIRPTQETTLFLADLCRLGKIIVRSIIPNLLLSEEHYLMTQTLNRVIKKHCN